jgi:hypothetical protein
VGSLSKTVRQQYRRERKIVFVSSVLNATRLHSFQAKIWLGDDCAHAVSSISNGLTSLRVLDDFGR